MSPGTLIKYVFSLKCSLTLKFEAVWLTSGVNDVCEGCESEDT